MHTIYSLSRVILHAQIYPHPHEYPARSIHYYQTGAGALGVVYGDIGTSPLYALRECFHASHGLTVTLPTIVGLLSLIIWAPLLVVTVKYLLFVMQADNQGEGGIVALMALDNATGRNQRSPSGSARSSLEPPST